MNVPPEADTPERPSFQSSRWFKFGVLLVIVGAAISGYWLLGEEVTLARLAEREQQLRKAQQSYPVTSVVVAFLVYVLVTATSLPGATVMTLLYGWLFPWWVALLLTSFASTTGATLAMLLSRYLFREVIQERFGDRLEKFNLELKREGAFYLFSLRLIPIFPFFVINLVMGLTPIKVWTFWWVSQLGMLAGTLIYVTAGHSAPSLAQLEKQGTAALITPQVLISLTLLGLFPSIAKKGYQWIASHRLKS
ncbi:MAG: TVP38/TMEM64 family protein [Pirellulaceae bacterium]